MGKRINIHSVQLVRESAKVYDLEDSAVTNPRAAYDILDKVFGLKDLPVEHFVMLAVSAKHKVVGAHTVHVGTLNMSIINPRDIFQRALLNNAHAIFIAHNHPSGDTKPSENDIEATERIIECGNLLGIPLLDHMIVGHDGKYISLKERGYI